MGEHLVVQRTGEPAGRTAKHRARRQEIAGPICTSSLPGLVGGAGHRDDHDQLLAARLAWFGSRWTRFLNGIGEDGACGGGKGMAGVAAVLGDSGQPAGE
jgi:hypothetical protein